MLAQQLLHLAHSLAADVGTPPAMDSCSYLSESEPQNQHAGSNKTAGTTHAPCSAPLRSICSPAKCAICRHDVSFWAHDSDGVLGVGTICAPGREKLMALEFTYI